MRTSIVLSLVIITGCGGGAPKAEEPKGAESASPAGSSIASADAKPDAEEKSEEAGKKIPDACTGDASACVMPKGFVKRLCGGTAAYPDLALMFFQKGSPWRRAYVAVKEVSPFNGWNGVSSDEKLVFEEELLVLAEKKVDTGGMQVSGAGSSFDVLRWDGTCATLSAEEVRLVAPPKPKHATIPWRVLEDATQDALRKNDALAKTAADRKKECKGATIGTVTAKCEKIDHQLNDLVADAVRTGTTIPQPAKVP